MLHSDDPNELKKEALKELNDALGTNVDAALLEPEKEDDFKKAVMALLEAFTDQEEALANKLVNDISTHQWSLMVEE